MRPPTLPARVAAASERGFEALSRTRGRRIFHPDGIAFRATLRVHDGVAGVPVLSAGVAHEAIARFSRGLGLPRGRTDFLGLAIRIGDEQDVLLASSSPRQGLRFVPLPARSFCGTTLSSLLPFHAGERVVLVAARVEGEPTAAGDQLVELEQAAAREPVTAALTLAEPTGAWRRFGIVEIGERLPADEDQALRFDPWRCAGGLVPWGRINRLRAPAYRGSRRGRASA
jgi:hypothetical protein